MEKARQNSSARGECPRRGDVIPFATGRLSAADRADVEAHLGACPACRRDADELGAVARGLAALPPAPPSRDLAPEIMRRIPDAAWGRRRPVVRGWFAAPVWLRAAAVVALVAGLGAAATRWMRLHGGTSQTASAGAPPPGVAPRAAETAADGAIAKGLAWLASAQEEDGRWDPVRWGAPRQHAVGITALSVLAFSSDDAAAAGAPHGEALRRGLRYLAAQQDAVGRFGPPFSGSPYNHALATLALLHAPAAVRAEDWTNRCVRALAVIRAAQDVGGGWGYGYAPERSAINASVTVWQLQALLAGQDRGFADAGDAIDRGLTWLVNTVNGQGLMGYGRVDDFPYGAETMTAAGLLCMLKSAPPTHQEILVRKMLRTILQTGGGANDPADYCRSYFVAHALDLAPNAESVKLAGLVRERLIARQSLAGGYAGSWSPDDRWGAGCGRVYATAISVLALHGKM